MKSRVKLHTMLAAGDTGSNWLERKWNEIQWSNLLFDWWTLLNFHLTVKNNFMACQRVSRRVAQSCSNIQLCTSFITLLSSSYVCSAGINHKAELSQLVQEGLTNISQSLSLLLSFGFCYIKQPNFSVCLHYKWDNVKLHPVDTK